MPCYEVGPMDGWMDGWMEWQEVAGDGDHKSFVEEKGMPKALLFTCVPCLQHSCFIAVLGVLVEQNQSSRWIHASNLWQG